MWTRKELKDKAKPSFKANYWKAVLMGLVLSILVGGLGMYSLSGKSASIPVSTQTTQTASQSVNTTDFGYGSITYYESDADEDFMSSFDGFMAEDAAMAINIPDGTSSASTALDVYGMILVFFALFLAAMAALAIAVAVNVFLLSPLEVGASRFFLRNLNQRAEVKEVAYAYDNNYKESVKTLFLRNLFIFLWALLLIIPGIYKAYQYRMIPYLLAEDATMTKDRAFAESKRMMDGQKWNAFVLDLSFVGWHILSALTLGILGVFYVAPYQAQTNAALYEKLRYGQPAPEVASQDFAPSVAPVTPIRPPVVPFAAVAAPAESAQADTTAPEDPENKNS